MKNNYQTQLDNLKERVGLTTNNKVHIQTYRLAVILEMQCMHDPDPEVRNIGYKAQDLQNQIERII